MNANPAPAAGRDSSFSCFLLLLRGCVTLTSLSLVTRLRGSQARQVARDREGVRRTRRRSTTRASCSGPPWPSAHSPCPRAKRRRAIAVLESRPPPSAELLSPHVVLQCTGPARLSTAGWSRAHPCLTKASPPLRACTIGHGRRLKKVALQSSPPFSILSIYCIMCLVNLPNNPLLNFAHRSPFVRWHLISEMSAFRTFFTTGLARKRQKWTKWRGNQKKNLAQWHLNVFELFSDLQIMTIFYNIIHVKDSRDEAWRIRTGSSSIKRIESTMNHDPPEVTWEMYAPAFFFSLLHLITPILRCSM